MGGVGWRGGVEGAVLEVNSTGGWKEGRVGDGGRGSGGEQSGWKTFTSMQHETQGRAMGQM